MPVVCGIKFRGSSKVYFFAPGELVDLHVTDHVVVETSRGKEIGQVATPPKEVPDGEIVGQLKPILGLATTLDLLDAQRYQQQEAAALAQCRQQVAKANLPMKVVSAEYNYDGSRLTFCFTSEQRVDFRELVRDLAHLFKTRIELRQVGVRDEAKLMGGVGKCGRPLCCSTWLTEFCPVSIRMAKQQDLPLTPMEISGLCGRLLCCLDYENAHYQAVKGRFPKVGKTVSTPRGSGKVIKVSVLRETATLLMEDGTNVELTADQIAGVEPIAAPQTGAEELRPQDLNEEETSPEELVEHSPVTQNADQASAVPTSRAQAPQVSVAPKPRERVVPSAQRPEGREHSPHGDTGSGREARFRERPRYRRSDRPAPRQEPAKTPSQPPSVTAVPQETNRPSPRRTNRRRRGRPKQPREGGPSTDGVSSA